MSSILSIDAITQTGVVLFSVPAIFLVARKNKWGFVLGLLSQPFWIATAICHGQRGVLLLSIIYTLNWIHGIYKWFGEDGVSNNKATLTKSEGSYSPLIKENEK